MTRLLLLFDHRPGVEKEPRALVDLPRRRLRFADVQRVWVIDRDQLDPETSALSSELSPIAWPFVTVGSEASRVDDVDAYAANRPVVWVGRDFDEEVRRWIAVRQAAGVGGLLLPDDGTMSLTDAVRHMSEWLAALPARRTFGAEEWSLGPAQEAPFVVGGLRCRSLFAFSTAVATFGAAKQEHWAALARPQSQPLPKYEDPLVSWSARYWNRYGLEFQRLLDAAVRAWLDQNPALADALVATGDALLDVAGTLPHDPSRWPLTREEFVARLHQERFRRGGW